MSTTKKKSPQKFSFAFVSINVIDSTPAITEPFSIDKKDLGYNISADTDYDLNNDEATITIQYLLYKKQDNNDQIQEIFRLKVANVFHIVNLKSHYNPDTKEIPKKPLIALFELSFAHLRGINFMLTRSTSLEKYIMPLIPASQLTSEPDN